MQETGSLAQRLMWVIWPSFLIAAVAETLFFTVFDPMDLHIFGAPLDVPRQTIYTIGFFGFWALCVASSALTVFMERSPWDAGRRTLQPGGRSPGSP
jgi:hypothetical protein